MASKKNCIRKDGWISVIARNLWKGHCFFSCTVHVIFMGTRIRVLARHSDGFRLPDRRFCFSSWGTFVYLLHSIFIRSIKQLRKPRSIHQCSEIRRPMWSFLWRAADNLRNTRYWFAIGPPLDLSFSSIATHGSCLTTLGCLHFLFLDLQWIRGESMQTSSTPS